MKAPYTTVRQLALSARNHRSKPAGNNTRAEIIDDDAVGIRLHSTYVVVLHSDGSVTLNSGGWRTVTTKARMNDWAPGVWVRSRHVRNAAQWAVYRMDWTPIAEFFDGITLGPDGTVLNASEAPASPPEPDLERYLKAYTKAAVGGIYVDALYQEPDGAQACWDCEVVANGDADLEGRTTEGGDPTAHLRRHVESCEIVPQLAWTAMLASGRTVDGTRWYLGSRDSVKVEPASAVTVRRAIRNYLRARLGHGTGARPVAYAGAPAR